MDNTRYLIIGSGAAGISAAKEIRRNDSKGRIILVSKEAYPPYYRTRLTELLSRDFDEDDILLHRGSWYQEQNIEILLSKIVEKIDTDKNIVVLDDGARIEYEKLLIATGSRPFIPPVAGKFKQGVLALRTLRDLGYIKNYVSNCNSIAIVGGGLLGLEAAWSLKSLGKDVGVLVRSSLLSKQLDDETASKLRDRLIEEGIDVHLSASVEEILGESKVDGVILDNGNRVEADMILFSVGIIPSIEVVRETPIEFNRGILVDDELKTNIDNIYAAGDVVEYDGRVLGLWSISSEQGKIAGANMSGKAMKYQGANPFTVLQIGDIKLCSVGDIQNFDDVYEYRDESQGIHHKLFTREDRLTGGILFGNTRDIGKLKNAVIDKMDIGLYLEDNLNFIRMKEN